MNPQLSICIKSFALAAAVTWSVFAAIDAMALHQYSSASQMSHASGAAVVAADTQQPRS